MSRADRRYSRRWNVFWPATLAVDGQRYGCTILDLSQSGARIDAYGLHAQMSRATLECEHFGSLEVRMAWVNGRKGGLRFAQSPGEIVAILKRVVPGMGRREIARPARPARTTFGRLRSAAA